jgi:FixJ family two-component response regulator
MAYYFEPSSGRSVQMTSEATRQVPAVVHIVEADSETRVTLSGLLAGAGLTCIDYADLLEFVKATPPDEPGCLVIDAHASMTGELGLRQIAQSRGRRYPVVVTAQGADVPTAVRAMKTGAVDFLEKPFREADVLEAIDTAIGLDRERRQIEAQLRELQERYATLSRRERQVMALVTAGKLNKQAAGDLGISEITVKAHRGVVMRKMQARTLAELVRMADALDAAEASETCAE